MVVVPGATLLTIPVEPMVATVVLLLLQVPPVVVSASVGLVPRHTPALPVMAPAPAALTIAVTMVVVPPCV